MLYQAIEDISVLDMTMRTITNSVRDKRNVAHIFLEGLFPTRVMQQSGVVPKFPSFLELGRSTELDT